MYENLNVEYKQEYSDTIKKSVVAFANTNGGIIYIGVTDDGTAIGIEDIDTVLLQITNSIRNSITPDITLFTTCDIACFNGVHIIKVEVQKGTACPYYITNKGLRPEGVFIRQGAASVPASEAAILRMIKDSDGDSYEELRSTTQNLTFEAMKIAFKQERLEFGTTQQRTLHLLNETSIYTNLALLLSEQCPHTIKLAVFNGRTKGNFQDRKECSGSLFSQLEEAFSYISLFNKTKATITGLYRQENQDYPAEAIREALVNTIVHRDYSFSGSSLISIFDDRIEFVSIGGLPKGISQEDIMLGISELRNPRLANIFYRLKLIEAYGSGIPKITACYETSSRKPTIETSPNAFKITLPNTNVIIYEAEEKRPHLTAREQDVAYLFSKKESIIRKDVEQELTVSQPMAVKLLRQLTDKEVIKKIGDGKNTRYELSGKS